MSKSQRTKGATFEREVVNDLKEIGIDCGRNLDQWRDGGGDIEINSWMIECKRRARISVYEWMDQCTKAASKTGKKPMVVCRADRKDTLVIMRWEDMLSILAKGDHDDRDEQPSV